jgi:phosphoribosylformimino-5-aminoimidazole carboxamide ribotide isomerase
MEFRPCIDIHNGKVKQIVGTSLQDSGNRAKENFVSEKNADFFAALYKEAVIKGGHVILLNPAGSEYYEETKRQALAALGAYPGGLQAGGGITPENALDFLNAGASHVIVTSYVFRDGRIHYDKLKQLRDTVGRQRVVLDLSCRKTADGYRIVTDRWQKITEEAMEEALLERLAEYCDEFLVHAVDVEGKSEGIEEELIGFLGRWRGLPVTYAGGVQSYGDLERIRELGRNRVHVTVGSALDLFGGNLSWKKIAQICDGRYRKENEVV